MQRAGWLAMAIVTAAGAAQAGGPPSDPFVSIDGGTVSVADFAGRPVLVANTASMCGFTPQYEGLQDLYDTYREQGLVVLAVPSDDFRQELASADEVKEFCAVNFGLDFPMTDITPVKGPDAHPFFQWVKAETGFEPRWNFNKVLVGPDGRVIQTWRSGTEPMSDEIRGAVEAALGG